MAIQYLNQHPTLSVPKNEKLNTWLLHTIEKEGFVFGKLSYTFYTDKELLQINKKFLNHDTYTDIITFDYNNNDVVIGEIFISLDRVLENSTKLHTDFKEEYYRVLIHGLLHLLGYKDKEKSDKILMTQKEDYYLSLLPSFISDL